MGNKFEINKRSIIEFVGVAILGFGLRLFFLNNFPEKASSYSLYMAILGVFFILASLVMLIYEGKNRMYFMTGDAVIQHQLKDAEEIKNMPSNFGITVLSRIKIMRLL